MMKNGLFFSCKIGELPDNTFDVVEFTLQEALSTLFTLTLTVASKQADIPLKEQLLKNASLTVSVNGTQQRTINGLVEHIQQGDTGHRRTWYTLVIRPELWVLTLKQDSRIFHFNSVPEILSQLLHEHQVKGSAQLQDKHQKREYVTQKRETDYDFFSRLAAEEGIAFWFEEESLFYSDSHLGMTAGVKMTYNLHPKSAVSENIINRLSLGVRMRPDEAIHKDRTYLNPDYALMHNAQPDDLRGIQSPYTFYDSYGRFQDDKTGEPFTRYRIQQLRSDAEAGVASSNSIQLRPGKIFEITAHPSAAVNERWQVISITHHGKQPQAVEEDGGEQGTTLTNEFSFISGYVDWRPPYHYKPLADGDEVATVVGPEGEEIYVNEHGAIRVHFHWNRYDQPDDTASCWVRVAQAWNGNQFGMMAIPRVGQEVIVSYLNGDIDRPIVTGTTFNAVNKPPYELPKNKTRMVLRSKTYKGEGFNELSFEDEPGKEEVYVHAQKDMKRLVENDDVRHVKHDVSDKIENERTVEITQNDSLKVDAERKTSVGTDDSLTVGSNLYQQIGDGWLAKAGQEIHFNAGSKVVIEAGTEMTLKAGGTFITLNPAGVHASPTLSIGTGSPAAGRGLSAKMPIAATALPPVQGLTSKVNAPYCEECEKCKNGGCGFDEASGSEIAGFGTSGFAGGSVQTGLGTPGFGDGLSSAGVADYLKAPEGLMSSLNNGAMGQAQSAISGLTQGTFSAGELAKSTAMQMGNSLGGGMAGQVMQAAQTAQAIQQQGAGAVASGLKQELLSEVMTQTPLNQLGNATQQTAALGQITPNNIVAPKGITGGNR